MNLARHQSGSTISREAGFTLPETIIAGVILVILAVGVLTAFDQVVRINRINNVRSQALTILQKEVEDYRAKKFLPGGTDADLYGKLKTTTKTNVASADGTLFNIAVTIDNNPYAPGTQLPADVAEADCRFKEITIEATLVNPAAASMDLNTVVSFQRVRLIA